MKIQPHIKNALKRKQREVGNSGMKSNPAYPKKNLPQAQDDDAIEEMQRIGKS